MASGELSAEADNLDKGALALWAGMVRVMDGPYTGPFNIGNPTEFTMLELAHVSPLFCPKVSSRPGGFE